MKPMIMSFKASCCNATPVFATTSTLTDWSEVYSLLPLVNHYSLMATPSKNLQSILENGVLPSKGSDRERAASYLYDIHPGTPRRNLMPAIGAVARTSAQVLELFRRHC